MLLKAVLLCIWSPPLRACTVLKAAYSSVNPHSSLVRGSVNNNIEKQNPQDSPNTTQLGGGASIELIVSVQSFFTVGHVGHRDTVSGEGIVVRAADLAHSSHTRALLHCPRFIPVKCPETSTAGSSGRYLSHHPLQTGSSFSQLPKALTSLRLPSLLTLTPLAQDEDILIILASHLDSCIPGPVSYTKQCLSSTKTKVLWWKIQVIGYSTPYECQSGEQKRDPSQLAQ